ncbi:hypothetical protein [Pseudomonas aeruginosa]|uniref:hypothetical protein n=1 Tax=Pseudomonas aeruginosa TaxID=287 RepID=UPI0032B3F6DE
MTSRIGAKALGDQLYSYIGAIQDLATAVREDLATAVREDLAFEGCEPGPRLTADQVDAIHLSIITIARLAGEDLIQLLTEMEVPA